MASCIESLLRPSRLSWSRLTPGHLKMLFRIGYEVQSDFIGDVIEEWLKERPECSPNFVDALLSCEFIWKSTLFSRFEMRILRLLTLDSYDLLTKVKRKLATIDAEPESLRNVLEFWRREIQAEINTYLNRCGIFMEALFKRDEVSAEIWDVVPSFVSTAEDIDLGKWLGMICKRDLEDINPRGCCAIRAVLKRHPLTYHRSLPGWTARTFSRFTRRFAEDKRLSEGTLKAVKDFGIRDLTLRLIFRLLDCRERRH